jgi:ligand-binding SRPBCC domain-containing protein
MDGRAGRDPRLNPGDRRGRTMGVAHVLERVQFLPRPVEEVFAYFADPANLNDLTPPSLHFRIVTPCPIEMRVGALIDYRLRVHGLPIRWRTAITHYNPPHSFTDEQVRGPYKRWVHLHTFTPTTRDGVNGTQMVDRVDYALPAWSPGIVNSFVHRAFVAPDLTRIFEYRRATLEKRFPCPQPSR